MLRRSAKHIIITLLLALLTTAALAQGSEADNIKQLQTQMYKLYPGTDYDQFIEVTERLKSAALKAGDEQTFYRAWGNQALFSANHQRRNRGLQIAKELQEYAISHNSRFGIYNGTHISAYVLAQMGSTKEAEKEFRLAVDYLHEHLPGESAASSLLELSKLAYNHNNPHQVINYAQQAMREPHLNPLHRLNALSLICLSVADSAMYEEPDYVQQFNQYYAEREEAKRQNGRDDRYGFRVDIWKSILAHDYDKALQISKSIPNRLSQLESQRYIFRQMGDYRKAYVANGLYHRLRDSVNAERNAHLLAEMTTAMDLGRIENEAKELKLNNQALQLKQAASELEQRRLEEEALNLTLKNQQVELQNAAVRLKNDSLDRHNKDLKLSEWESKMQAQKSAERAHHVFMLMLGLVAAIVIAALLFFLHRRNRHMRRLKQAYDQLEETTSAKERIESELRIARDIQLSMVPRQFPAFPDVPQIDLYAHISPAKAVGGDLYDYIYHPGKLYFCIGDVSGKGVPASMTMAVAVNLFRTIANEGFPPSYIATKLNDTLSANNESAMFVTMFIGEIDIESGTMYFCNAGHNPPVIIGPATDDPSQPASTHFLQMEPNAPIGLWPGLEFTAEHIDNIKGNSIFLYTDGVNEAENIRQEQFSDERLIDVLAHAQLPAGQCQPKTHSRHIVERVSQAVQAHVGEAEPSDDLTMLCIKVE